MEVQKQGVEKRVIDIGVGGHTAILTTERMGQIPPSQGDDVRVRYRIYLPTPIPAELQYGTRCRLVGASLYTSWGYDGAEKTLGEYAYRERTVEAPTYREAEATAWEHLNKEIGGLLEVVSRRRVALQLASV